MPADGINRCRSRSGVRQLPLTAPGDITPAGYICGEVTDTTSSGVLNPKRLVLAPAQRRPWDACTLANDRDQRPPVSLSCGAGHAGPRGMSGVKSAMDGETGSYFLFHPAFAAMLSTV